MSLGEQAEAEDAGGEFLQPYLPQLRFVKFITANQGKK